MDLIIVRECVKIQDFWILFIEELEIFQLTCDLRDDLNILSVVGVHSFTIDSTSKNPQLPKQLEHNLHHGLWGIPLNDAVGALKADDLQIWAVAQEEELSVVVDLIRGNVQLSERNEGSQGFETCYFVASKFQFLKVVKAHEIERYFSEVLRS